MGGGRLIPAEGTLSPARSVAQSASGDRRVRVIAIIVLGLVLTGFGTWIARVEAEREAALAFNVFVQRLECPESLIR